MTFATVSKTFAVSDVSPATNPLLEVPYHRAVTDFLSSPIESCSRYHGKLLDGVRSHPLIGALHTAFSFHRPITLAADGLPRSKRAGVGHFLFRLAPGRKSTFLWQIAPRAGENRNGL